MDKPGKARKVVVVGTSAGGVDALQQFFQVIDPDTHAAFLVVMHIPPQARSNLDRILARSTRLPVIAAYEDQALKPGTVYVATPDRHLMLDAQGVRVTRGPRECRARPAIDVLFRSAAVAYGRNAIGVVLTGALDDGTAGLWAIKDRNGFALVQDPAEAMHSSMPQSAIDHVKVDFVAPVRSLAERIGELVSEQALTHEPAPSPANEHLVIENRISMSGKGLEEGVFGLGKVSRYTCPECHGALVEIKEGRIIRFRCHTGHAYSLKTLIGAINESVDEGLWDVLRALEERILLLRQMAELASEAGHSADAAYCLEQADRAHARLEPLREVVLDLDIFGSPATG